MKVRILSSVKNIYCSCTTESYQSQNLLLGLKLLSQQVPFQPFNEPSSLKNTKSKAISGVIHYI